MRNDSTCAIRNIHRASSGSFSTVRSESRCALSLRWSPVELFANKIKRVEACIDAHGHHFKLTPYLLTPWCRVLLEKLTGLHLVKKFPAFHGTRRFITALTSVRHLSLSWPSPIQSIYPHPTSWRSILILSIYA